MKKLLISIFLFASMMVECLPNVYAEENYEYASDEEVTFIIEVEGDPLSVYESNNSKGGNISTYELKTYEDELINSQEEVLDLISEKIDYDITPDCIYTSALNGFSIDAEFGDMEKLKKLPGVKNVYISHEFKTPEPYLSTALEQAELTEYVTETCGYTGKGKAVAIIDNEFEITHDFLKQAPPNPKIKKTDVQKLISNKSLYQYVTSADSAYISAKIPFAFNYATKNYTVTNSRLSTHGTHVAGIAAGSGAISSENTIMNGAARDAQLVLVAIANQNGSMSESYIIQAINDAIKLGVTAINMSLGNDYMPSWYNTAFIQAVNNAKSAGIFISAASGNIGRGYKEEPVLTDNIDYGVTGTPATFVNSTGVASVNNILGYALMNKLIMPSGCSSIYSYSENSTFKRDFSDKFYPYVYCEFDDAGNIAPDNLDGKIALIRRGGRAFTTMADKVKAAGGIGIVIWNTEEAHFAPVELSIPGAGVSFSDGQYLFDETDKRLKTVEMLSHYSTATDGQMSDFSSWGTSESLDLKPEITAPGGMIYSSNANNTYYVKSGTSMAAPAITGFAAVLSQYVDETNTLTSGTKTMNRALLIENLMMTSATVIKKDGVPCSPRNQGSGLINVEKAIKNPYYIQGSNGKAKLNLGDELTNKLDISFQMKNISKSQVSFDSITFDVLTDDYTTENGKTYVGGMKRLKTTSNAINGLTINSGAVETVSFSINLDQNELNENMKIFKKGFYIDGFIYLNKDGEEVCHIPFTGFYGRWDKVKNFDELVYTGNNMLPTNYAGSGNKTLGQNIFTNEYFGDRISISPNSDGNCDTLDIYLQPLRSANMIYFVVDGDDNIETSARADAKFSVIATSLIKFSAQKYQVYPSLNGVTTNPEDGEYKLVMYADDDANREFKSPTHDEVLCIPFTVDTQKPVINNVMMSNDKRKVRVTAQDNNYIQAITIYTADKKEYPAAVTKADNIGKNTPVTKDIILPDVDLTGAKIRVYDYAMNVLEADFSNYLPDLVYTLTSAVKTGTSEKLKYTITNTTSSTLTTSVVIASYDANGQLVQIDSPGSISVSKGANQKEFTIPYNQNAKEMKLFLWDSLQSMKPLSSNF